MSNEDIKMSECCTCGTKWRTGQDGRHSCTRPMALRIKELESALVELMDKASECDSWESFPAQYLDDARKVLEQT